MGEISLAQQTAVRMQNSPGFTTFEANVTGSWLSPKSQTWYAKSWSAGKWSPPICSQPSFHSCKSSRFASEEQSALFMLQHGPFPCSYLTLASPQLHSLRSGKFIFACGAENPWTVSACIYVWIGYSCSCAPETSGGFCFPEHKLHKVGAIRPQFTKKKKHQNPHQKNTHTQKPTTTTHTQKSGAGEGERLFSLQCTLGKERNSVNDHLF